MHLWRIRSALSSVTPALTMLGTLGLAAWLRFSGAPTGGIFAFAQADVEMVAAIEVGRVASIEVDVGDEVTPGQVLVTLDSGAIDAELAVARADVERLRALIPAEHARLDLELEAGVEDLKLELAREVEEQRRASAEGQVLASEISRVKRLIEDKQASLDVLGSLDVQRAGVDAIATEKPRTIQLLRAQIAVAGERRKKLLQQASPETAKIEADLAMARRSAEQLEVLRAQQTLRAAHGGRVSAVRKRPGDVAVPGDPIVEIANARGQVIACLPDNSVLHVEAGDTATLWARGGTGRPLTGRAVTVGAMVTQLPLRCWTDLNVPVWGREVTIALDHPVDLLAGQPFDVAFERSSTAPPAPPAPGAPAAPVAKGAPAAAPPARAADALRMTVPAALRQRTRFEPSGILPRPTEARYLLVSDDTGHKDEKDEGVPWLFAMSAAGAVDPEPVPVNGVKELADIESITAGDGGDVYLLSSQGYSAKGKRKKARTALLRLKPDGRGFRVDAEAHLAELLDAAGPAALAQLGLPGGTRPLEIEGMAYRDGALYFGLKSPLDAEGNALIWKLGAPRALFEARGLDGAGLSLWARARVDVELDGAPTPGGISDLCFLPDGSLAIASTPSTADGAAGSLFHVLRPEGGVLSPSLVRRFPGQKPEGISLALSPGKLIVVFDAGAEAPFFLEMPWQG